MLVTFSLNKRNVHSFSVLCFVSEAQRKYDDNCDSLHEGSVSETAENSGEEAGEGGLDVEAGEMTDGGEDDYDEEGNHHLVSGKRSTGLMHFGRSQLGTAFPV